ncbi:pentatricopeptide repeat-containing protein At5g02860-like [Vigna umbellata]|uniref:pentatricopeptide repeat-containing protein At5g02860-like n=1 Tax=Vigna umbellata TaxID=87088 RepID=UPI001F5EADC8|nr:pentatricopeptide repeat-containing protein At5g02860-like [Vigna umbellata]
MGMVEKVALPLLLPNPPPPSQSPSSPSPPSSKPNSVGVMTPGPSPTPTPTPTSAPPMTTLIHDLNTGSSSRSRHRVALGKSFDPNRGKPWSPHGLSSSDNILRPLLDQPNPASDILGIIKALGFNNKCELAFAVFQWVRTTHHSVPLFTTSAITVIFKILGKAGRVSSAASLLLALQNDGVHIDVYAYTCLINAYSSSGRYRDAVNLFNKMQQDGCNPTLITYNVVLNVYGKMGMPWSNVTALVDSMKSRGIAPDLYTLQTY